ncbi:Transcriptional regulator [Amycolatopsis camponoti]|uniref:Transcriptional regulator n=2 Tax=Amycolatopsis camponoti TaxID=2606593 RepID=A0A6I8LZH5_9PSEU|nr:Transcriptional regulator [Amycolatopsis camponoti]
MSGTEPSGPVPRQLPADVRGFVNRLQDLARLDEIIDDSAAPGATIVVVGTAGVGKTSLAVHWAHRVRARFPDGQLYVNLHGYDPGPPITPHEVLERFLHALTVPVAAVPADLESRAALFRSLLSGRRMLVVLDNAATVGQVRPLLPGSSECLVLVTSRSSLSGLVARDGARRLSLRVLSEDEATELIQRITSGYRDQDDTAELAELARLCARLPLALRIAAERAINRPWTPLRDLITELRDESALWDALTADDDDESDAGRTVFAWSYRALTPEVSRMFRLLGLHPGAEFSLAAAAALAGRSPAKVRHVLDDLVGAHLLEQPQADRYQFHDLLRMYANDQARAEETAEDAFEAAHRVLSWYLHGALAARERLGGGALPWTPAPAEAEISPPAFPDRTAALTWYAQERENLVRAVRAADDLDISAVTWQLPAALYPIYAEHNHFGDWIETSTIALRVTRRLGDRAAEAEVLESLGKAHTQHFDRARGIELQSAALRLRRELDDPFGELKSANALGLARLRARELTAARDLFDRVTTLAGVLGEQYWLAVAANNTANVDLELESFERAQQLLTDALARFRRLGLRSGEGDALRGLSRTERELGRPAEAYEHIRAAVAIAREDENPAREAFWLLELGRAQVDLGQPSDALETFRRSATLQRQLGDRVREAEAWDATGTAYQAMGRAEEAVPFCRRAVSVFRELNETWLLALALEHLGAALADSGSAGEAAEGRRGALALFERFPDPRAQRHFDRLAAMLTS